jgi:N-acetylmuramoyl-L-alanine amidase
MGVFMLILNRKRILLVLSSVFVAIFAFMFSTENTSNLNGTVETVSLPVSGKTIVVDAGHGVPDEGDKMLKLKNNEIFYT